MKGLIWRKRAELNTRKWVRRKCCSMRVLVKSQGPEAGKHGMRRIGLTVPARPPGLVTKHLKVIVLFQVGGPPPSQPHSRFAIPKQWIRVFILSINVAT